MLFTSYPETKKYTAMRGYTALLALASLSFAPCQAADTATDMGPAAFLWPPDRAWSSAADNTAPCGSNADIGNRTEFPLSKVLRLTIISNPF